MVQIFEWSEECPYCDSNNIISNDVYEIDGEIYDAWSCDDCNKEWASP